MIADRPFLSGDTHHTQHHALQLPPSLFWQVFVMTFQVTSNMVVRDKQGEILEGADVSVAETVCLLPANRNALLVLPNQPTHKPLCAFLGVLIWRGSLPHPPCSLPG